MALQMSTTARNNLLDSIQTTVGTSPHFIIYSGAVSANCAAADPTGTLADITCPSSWMAAASGGTKALSGTWSATASGGSSTAPQSWRIKDSTSTTCHLQGTAAVGSGDVNFNGSITSGQTVTITAFTITAGNS